MKPGEKQDSGNCPDYECIAERRSLAGSIFLPVSKDAEQERGSCAQISGIAFWMTIARTPLLLMYFRYDSCNRNGAGVHPIPSCLDRKTLRCR